MEIDYCTLAAVMVASGSCSRNRQYMASSGVMIRISTVVTDIPYCGGGSSLGYEAHRASQWPLPARLTKLMNPIGRGE